MKLKSAHTIWVYDNLTSWEFQIILINFDLNTVHKKISIFYKFYLIKDDVFIFKT